MFNQNYLETRLIVYVLTHKTIYQPERFSQFALIIFHMNLQVTSYLRCPAAIVSIIWDTRLVYKQEIGDNRILKSTKILMQAKIEA